MKNKDLSNKYNNKHNINKLFDLSGRIAIITGGAGLLGFQHASAIAEAGGTPIIVDINEKTAKEKSKIISDNYNVKSIGIRTDITIESDVKNLLDKILTTFGQIDILINNAAIDPKVNLKKNINLSRLENFSIEQWNKELSVGLTGAMICSKIIGSQMSKSGAGVILNISSDLGVIAPDQRLYKEDGLHESQQSVKPITYSVIKHGLNGLSKYLATYWADKGVRVNSISPGGVYNNQDSEFVERLSKLIPMGRMAYKDEYKAAIVFMVSDASSYMTGANLVVDGGRSCW